MRALILLCSAISAVSTTSIINVHLTGFQSSDGSDWTGVRLSLRACVSQLDQIGSCNVATDRIYAKDFEFPKLWLYITESDYKQLNFRLIVRTDDTDIGVHAFNSTTVDLMGRERYQSQQFFGNFLFEFYGAARNTLIPRCKTPNVISQYLPFSQLLEGRCDRACVMSLLVVGVLLVIPSLFTAMLFCCCCKRNRNGTDKTHPKSASLNAESKRASQSDKGNSTGWLFDARPEISLPLERSVDHLVMTTFSTPTSSSPESQKASVV